MAVRIQLRRDTAANWVSSNPVLRAGELGIETDTLKFKIGNGSAWNSISNYANVVPSDLNTTLGDYVLVSDIGAQGGVVGLNNSYNAIIPGTSIILEGPTADSYETTLSVTDPTEDRTITFPDATGTVALTSQLPTQYTDELAQDAVAAALAAGTHTNITVTYNDNANTLSLAAAPGYVDEQAVDAVAAALAAGTHTNITVSYNDEANSISLTGATTYSDENAQDAVGNAVGTGLSYNDSTGAISVDTTTIQARVADVSDTEIGYLNGVTSGIQTQLNDKAPINNPTFTGTVTLPGNPSTANEAATKSYVDNISAGLNFHAAVHAATTADLSATYDNSAKTLSASGAFPQIDGHTISETERVLVKSQTNAVENGIYTLTDDGDPSGTWVLTRAADADNTPSGEMAYGDFTFVQNGTSNGGQGFIMTTTGTITLGTSNIVYTQFNTGQSVIAGNGLTETSPGTLAINTSITADLSTAQTLTNKTLTSPVISTISNTGTITVPSTTGTLALTSQLPTTATPTTAGTVFGRWDAPNLNAGFGFQALATVGSGGIRNTAIGYQVMQSGLTTGGEDNTGVGYQALQVVSSGYSNVAVGFLALNSNTSGNTNTAIGSNALTSNTTGRSNTAIGQSSLRLLNDTNAIENTAVGRQSGYAVTWGANNVLIGYNAGYSGTNNLTTGSNNIIIGSSAAASASTVSNEITLGNASISSFRIPGLSLTVNSSNPIVQLTSTQTLTNKTLTSPVISTITNTGTLTLPTSTDTLVGRATTDTLTNKVIGATSTTTVSANTATTIDTNALSSFTTVKYVVSIKQGSKIRSSEIIAQTDGTNVDYTEFGITETGGTMTGVLVEAVAVSTNAVLRVTITDAATTNATVKIQEVLI